MIESSAVFRTLVLTGTVWSTWLPSTRCTGNGQRWLHTEFEPIVGYA
jgi:hypothetical protein